MNILWDFDGTLFNTYPAYTAIFREVMDQEVSEQEVMASLKVSFSYAIRQFQLTEEEVQEIHRREQLLDPAQTPPFPGVESILAATEKNVIMTHKNRDGVNAILSYYGWERYFAEMVAGDDGYPRKPDPASYRYLHEKHRVDLVIGDRELDILPGKALGIKTCLFQNETPGADYYLWDYQDFNRVILGR